MRAVRACKFDPGAAIDALEDYRVRAVEAALMVQRPHYPGRFRLSLFTTSTCEKVINRLHTISQGETKDLPRQ